MTDRRVLYLAGCVAGVVASVVLVSGLGLAAADGPLRLALTSNAVDRHQALGLAAALRRAATPAATPDKRPVLAMRHKPPVARATKAGADEPAAQAGSSLPRPVPRTKVSSEPAKVGKPAPQRRLFAPATASKAASTARRSGSGPGGTAMGAKAAPRPDLSKRLLDDARRVMKKGQHPTHGGARRSAHAPPSARDRQAHPPSARKRAHPGSGRRSRADKSGRLHHVPKARRDSGDQRRGKSLRHKKRRRHDGKPPHRFWPGHGMGKPGAPPSKTPPTTPRK